MHLKHDESSEAVMRMFDDLVAATAQHFDTESRYMREQQYPERERHETEHARLVNEVEHFKAQFSQGRELLVLQLMKDWLLHHIVHADKKLGEYLVQHGMR